MRINIRTKLMLVFMTLVTLFLPGVFYWFYQFSTQQMMGELRQNLMVSASVAANMINAEQHARVLESGVEGDADYEEIAQALRVARDANPRIEAVYTAVKSSSGNPDELMFVVSAEESEDRAHLREPYDASNAPVMIKAFEGNPIADVETGADEFGVWLSGYAPIRDESGNTVAIVGVDMLADDISAMQGQIQTISILVFVIAYASVFIAVILISGAITKPLTKITTAARVLENDEPYDAKQLESLARGKDELGILAHVFNEMAGKVYQRQEVLKQEVVKLRIEIDQAKRKKEVEEIVDSDYFQELKAKSDLARKRRTTKNKE
jgi:methyl-accepting chemotaxis protein